MTEPTVAALQAENERLRDQNRRFAQKIANFSKTVLDVTRQVDQAGKLTAANLGQKIEIDAFTKPQTIMQIRHTDQGTELLLSRGHSILGHDLGTVRMRHDQSITVLGDDIV